MPQTIKTIDLGGVNCFLVKTGDGGYVLIDTGVSTKRADLEKELESAGCQPGTLRLIILTHGDIDHAGNAAYLRDKYGAKIAMHSDDAGMVERGDMSWNRKAKPDRVSAMFRIITFFARLFVRQSQFDTVKPDVTLGDGYALSEYGLDARVLHLPGHSKGSIGILTTSGDPSAGQALFCGDLLYNFSGRPGCLYIDDLAEFDASVEKLKGLEIKTVYPGHGKPFAMKLFIS